MATKKEAPEGSVRKLTRIGAYSYYVTLPKDALVELGWRRGQKLVVRRSGRKLIIEDW